MRIRLPHLLAAVLLLGALAACGDDGGSSATTGLGSLRGHTYVGNTITVNGADAPTLAQVRIEITFGADGQLRARAGCNTMGGKYSFDGDTLVAPELAMTAMGCDAELMALDTQIATLLGAKPVIGVADGRVTISAAPTSITLVDLESVEPTATLETTVWVLDTLISGESASTLPQGLPKPITFRLADQHFTLDTGCNGFGGTYKSSGDTLTLDVGPTTLKGCADPLGSLEGTIGTILGQGPLRTSIERQHLTLTATDGHGLGFTAAPR
jgi:heat shock protein HslJ